MDSFRTEQRRTAGNLAAVFLCMIGTYILFVSGFTNGAGWRHQFQRTLMQSAERMYLPQISYVLDAPDKSAGEWLAEQAMSLIPIVGYIDEQKKYEGYAEDEETILEDEGTFYYNTDSGQVMVKMSKTTEVAPEELLSGEATEWNGLTVYAGENEAQDKRMAALQKGNVRYFVMSYGMSEKEFETFLKKFF